MKKYTHCQHFQLSFAFKVVAGALGLSECASALNHFQDILRYCIRYI